MGFSKTVFEKNKSLIKKPFLSKIKKLEIITIFKRKTKTLKNVFSHIYF